MNYFKRLRHLTNGEDIIRHLKHKLAYITACLLVVFAGCDNAPRVQLVKDNYWMFHFQWDKPLKEERIILVSTTGESGEYFKAEWENWGTFNSDYFVYFPAGSYVSALVDSYSEHRRIHSVEILPAHLRNTVDFPARLYVTNDGKLVLHGDQVILRDHPFFQEYRIGKPSRLDFAFD